MRDRKEMGADLLNELGKASQTFPPSTEVTAEVSLREELRLMLEAWPDEGQPSTE